jgi:hypothetical protein
MAGNRLRMASKSSHGIPIERFPTDFMFELTAAEMKDWRSQFVTSS